LSWVGTAQTLDYLQQALTITSAECTLEIIRVLGCWENPVLKPKSAQILIDFLNSTHSAAKVDPVKQAVAQAWGELGDVSAIDALVALLADPSASVRLHAMAALKKFPTVYQKLQQLAANEQLLPNLKAGIAIALAEWNI
jgi:hypothetical protein